MPPGVQMQAARRQPRQDSLLEIFYISQKLMLLSYGQTVVPERLEGSEVRVAYFNMQRSFVVSTTGGTKLFFSHGRSDIVFDIRYVLLTRNSKTAHGFGTVSLSKIKGVVLAEKK